MARERSTSQTTHCTGNRHYVPRGRSVRPGQGDRRRPSSRTPHLDRFRRYHRHPLFERPLVAHSHAPHGHHISLNMHDKHHGFELNHRHDSPVRSGGEIPAEVQLDVSNIEAGSDLSFHPGQTEEFVEVVGQETIPASTHLRKVRIVRATHLRELPDFESFPDNMTDTEAAHGYVMWNGVSGKGNAIENFKQQQTQTLICGRGAEEIISLASTGMNKQLTQLKRYSRSLGVPSLQEVSASAVRCLPQQLFQDDEEHPFPSCLYPKPVTVALSSRSVENTAPVEDIEKVVRRPHAHAHSRSSVKVSLMHEASHDSPEAISLKLLPDIMPEAEPEPENIEMPSDLMPPPLEEEVEVRLLPVGDSKKFMAQKHCHKGLNTSAALLKTLSIKAYVGLEMAYQITLLTLKVLNKRFHIYGPIAAQAFQKRYRIFLRKSAPVARHVKQEILTCLRETRKGCVKQMKKHTLGKACISCLNLDYSSRENSIQDLDFIDYMQHDIPDRPSHRDAELAWRESLRVYSVTPKLTTPRSRVEPDEPPRTHLLQLPDGSCTCPHYHDHNHDHNHDQDQDQNHDVAGAGPVDSLVPVTFVDPQDRFIEELPILKDSSDYNANQTVAIIESCTMSAQEKDAHSRRKSSESAGSFHPIGASQRHRGAGQDAAILRCRRRLLSSPTSTRGRVQAIRSSGAQGLGPLAWPPPEEIHSSSGDPFRDYILAAGLTVRPHRRVTDLLQKTPVEEEGLWRRTLRAHRKVEKPLVKPRPEDVLLVRKPLKMIKKKTDAVDDAEELAIVEPGAKNLNNSDGESAVVSALASHFNHLALPSSASEKEVKSFHKSDDKLIKRVEYRQLQHVFGGGRAVHHRSPRARVDSHSHKLDSTHNIRHEKQSGRLAIDSRDSQLDGHKAGHVGGGNEHQHHFIEDKGEPSSSMHMGEIKVRQSIPMQTSEADVMQGSNRTRHGKRGHSEDTKNFQIGLEAYHGHDHDHDSAHTHSNCGPVLAHSSREDLEALGLLSSSPEASPPHAKRRNLEVLFPPDPHIVKPKFSKGPLIRPPIHRLSSDRSKIDSPADYGKDEPQRSLKTTPSGWSRSRQGTPREGSRADEIGTVFAVRSEQRPSSHAHYRKPSHTARLQQISHGTSFEKRRRPRSQSPDQYPRESLMSTSGRKDLHRVFQSPYIVDKGAVRGGLNAFPGESGGLGDLTLASLDRYSVQNWRPSGLFRRKNRVRSFSKKRTSRFSALKDGLLHYLPSQMLISLRRSSRLMKKQRPQSRDQFRKESRSITKVKIPSFFKKRGVTPSPFQRTWSAGHNKHVTTVSDVRPPRLQSADTGSLLSKVLLQPSTSQHQESNIMRSPRPRSEHPPRLKIFLSKKDIENAHRGVMISAGSRSMQKRLTSSSSLLGGDHGNTEVKKLKIVNTLHNAKSRSKSPEETLDQGTFCNLMPDFSRVPPDLPSTGNKFQKPVSYMNMSSISCLRFPKFKKTTDLKSPSSSERPGHTTPKDQPKLQKKMPRFANIDDDHMTPAFSPIKSARKFEKRDTGYPGKFKLPRDVTGARSRSNTRPNPETSQSQGHLFPNQRPSLHPTQHPTVKDDDIDNASQLNFPDKDQPDDEISGTDSYREEEAKMKSMEDDIINEYLENLAPSPLATRVTESVPPAGGFSVSSQATDANNNESAPPSAETLSLSTSLAAPKILISHLPGDDGENEDQFFDSGSLRESQKFDSEPEIIPSATGSEPMSAVSKLTHGGDTIGHHASGTIVLQKDEAFTRAEPDPNLTPEVMNSERLLSKDSIDDGHISENPDFDDVILTSRFPQDSHSPGPIYAVADEAGHRKGDDLESEVLEEFNPQKSDKHDQDDEISHFSPDESRHTQDPVYVPGEEPSHREAKGLKSDVLRKYPSRDNSGLPFLEPDTTSSHRVYERGTDGNVSPEIPSHSEHLLQPTADVLNASKDPGRKGLGSLDSSNEDVYQGEQSQTASGDAKFETRPFDNISSSPTPQTGDKSWEVQAGGPSVDRFDELRDGKLGEQLYQIGTREREHEGSVGDLLPTPKETEIQSKSVVFEREDKRAELEVLSPSEQVVETDEARKRDGNEEINRKEHAVDRSQASTSQILPESFPAADQSVPALQSHKIHSPDEVQGGKQYSAHMHLSDDNHYVGEPTGGEILDTVHGVNVTPPIEEHDANGNDRNLVEGNFGRMEKTIGAAPPQFPGQKIPTLDPSNPFSKDGEVTPITESDSKMLRAGVGYSEMGERNNFPIAVHGHHMEGEAAGENIRSDSDGQGGVLHEDEPIAREDPSESLHSVAPQYNRRTELKDPLIDGLVFSFAPTGTDDNSMEFMKGGAAEHSFQPVVQQMTVDQDEGGDKKYESDISRTFEKVHDIATAHIPVPGVSENRGDVIVEIDEGETQSDDRGDLMEFESFADSALNLLKEMKTLETDLSVVSGATSMPSSIDNETRISSPESHLMLNAEGDDQGNDVHEGTQEILFSTGLQHRLPAAELPSDSKKDVVSDENVAESKPRNNDIERDLSVDRTGPGRPISTGRYNNEFESLKDLDERVADDATTIHPDSHSYSHLRANSGDAVQNNRMEAKNKIEEEEDSSDGLEAAASEFLKELQNLGQLVPLVDPDALFPGKDEDHGQLFEAHPGLTKEGLQLLQTKETEKNGPGPAGFHEIFSSVSGEGENSLTTDEKRANANEGTDVANLDGLKASRLKSQLFEELKNLDQFVSSLHETIPSNKTGEASQSGQQVDENLRSDKRELEPAASHHATQSSEVGLADFKLPQNEKNSKPPEEKDELEEIYTDQTSSGNLTIHQRNLRRDSNALEERETSTTILQSAEATMESDINIRPSAVNDRNSKEDMESRQHQLKLPFGTHGSQETDSPNVVRSASQTISMAPTPSNLYSKINQNVPNLQFAETLMSPSLQSTVQRTAYDDTYIGKAGYLKKDPSSYKSRELIGLDLGGVSNAPALSLSDEYIISDLKGEYGVLERSRAPETRIKITKSAEVIEKREIGEVKYSSNNEDVDVEQFIEAESSGALQIRSSSFETSITTEFVSRSYIDPVEDKIEQDEPPSPDAVPQIVLGLNSLPSSSSSTFSRSSIIDQDKFSALGFSNKISAYKLLSSLGEDLKEQLVDENDKPEFRSNDVTSKPPLEFVDPSLMLSLSAAYTSKHEGVGPQDETAGIGHSLQEKLRAELQSRISSLKDSKDVKEEGLNATRENFRRDVEGRDPGNFPATNSRVSDADSLPTMESSLIRSSEMRVDSEDLGASAANTANNLDDGPRDAGIFSAINAQDLAENTPIPTTRPRIRSTFVRPVLKRTLVRTSETDRTIDRLQLEVGSNISEVQYTATDVEQIDGTLQNSETKSESGIVSSEDSDDLDGKFPNSRSRNKSLFVRPILKNSLVRTSQTDRTIAQLQLETRNDENSPSAVNFSDARSEFDLSVNTSERQDLDTSREGAERVLESMKQSFTPTRSKSFVRPVLKKSLIRTSETDPTIAQLQSENQEDESFEDARSDLSGNSGGDEADSTRESEGFESDSSTPDILGAIDVEGKLMSTRSGIRGIPKAPDQEASFAPSPSRSKSSMRPLLKKSLTRSAETDNTLEQLNSNDSENENFLTSLREERSKMDGESSSQGAGGFVLSDTSPFEKRKSDENLVSNRPRIKSTFVRPVLDSRLIESLESGQNISKLQSERDQDRESFSSLAEKREEPGGDIRSRMQDLSGVSTLEGPGLKLLLTPESPSPADSDTESLDGTAVITRSTRNRSLFIRPTLKKSLIANLELEQMFAQLQQENRELEATPVIENTSTTGESLRRPAAGDDSELDRSRTFEGQSESVRSSESSSVSATAQASQGNLPTDRVRNKSVFVRPNLKRSLTSSAETDPILAQLRSKNNPPAESEDSGTGGAGKSEEEQLESAASSIQDSQAYVNVIDTSTDRSGESFGQD